MSTDLRVYVSSTSIDLKEYRAAVISALRKMGTTPVCMEDYVAQDMLPVDKCLADVAKSEVYVGIFAWRYGFIPPGYEQSITELEYRKAVECGIPTLIFLLDENAGWRDDYRDMDKVAARIKALRGEFTIGKMVGWFTNPHHLASEVQSAVSRVFMQKVMGQRYAEVSIATTLEQSESVKQAMTLLQEMMRQQSERSRQTACDPIPIQLPKLRGVFVDREAERDTLHHCLRAEDKRLVVVVAPGGYGKTELTTKVLKEIAPSTSIINGDVQGILYLKCVKADITLGQIFAEAGRIVGKRDEFREVYANKELTLNKKMEYFFSELSKAGNVWIVMDNFEDLLDPVDDSICDQELREFLETASAIEHNIRMIITSRAVPRFKGSRKAEKIDLSAGLPEDQAIRYLREEGAEYGLAEEDENILRAFVRRVHRIPKALESMLGYLEDHYPAIKLSDLLKDDTLFVDFDRHDLENGLKGLVSQQFKNQSPDAQLVLSALSIFPKPAPQAVLRYLLQAIESAEFSAIMSRLEKNRLINHNNGYYDLHPIVRSFVYERVPEGSPLAEKSSSDNQGETLALTRSNLHSRAAAFYKELRKPKEEWKTIDDLEPQLQEFHHLVHAGQYESAARVLDVIDFDYLQIWGHTRIVIEMREQLLGNLKDSYLNRANLGNFGVCYNLTGRVLESIQFLEKALESARSDNSKKGIFIWLASLGNAYSDLGDDKKAIEYHEQALSIARDFGNRGLEGEVLGNLGTAYSDLGDDKKAIESHEQALSIAREFGNRRLEGRVLGNLGIAYSHLGDVKKAIEYHEQSLSIAREFGNRRSEGRVLGNLGTAYSHLGDVKKAIEYYEQALAISREIGDRCGEEPVLSKLGNTYYYLGETRKAMEYYEQALSISREIGNRGREGKALHKLGNAYSELGETRKAIEYYEQALSIVREVGNMRGEGTVLGQLGYAYSKLGQTRKAMEYYEQTLTIAREKGDRPMEGTAFSWIGNEYLNLGDIQKGVKYFERALTIARETDYRPGEGGRLGNLGLAYFELGAITKALEYYEEALAIAREIESPFLISMVLNESAYTHHNIGQLADAWRGYEEALSLGIHETDFSCSVLMGILRMEEGKEEEANMYLTHGIDLCRNALGKSQASYAPLYKLALALLAFGDLQESKNAYKQALDACSEKGIVNRALKDLSLLERAKPGIKGLEDIKSVLIEVNT